jgi:prepilin-type processing-associated H-X9-DG protein
MSYITAIGTANPAHRFEQNFLADFMTKAMQLNATDSHKLKTIFRASGIEHRYSVLEDYGKTSGYTFYANSPDFEPFPSTDERLKVFRTHALSLSVDAVTNMKKSLPLFDSSSITHLIVVCCTGMYAPGLDIELVDKLNLRSTVERTCITFMGCYAAFNALKVADAFCCKNENAKVLVVCTELCSLHFQKNVSEDNFLANALFADGSAAVLVEGKAREEKCMMLEAFYSDLAPEGSNDMAWSIGNAGFEMKLSSYVPDIIKSGIANLTRHLLAKISQEIEDVKYFAIHPGGKRILTAIEEALSLRRDQTQAAFDVLRRYGNMSSPTVLFVLLEIFKNLSPEDHEARILSFAFGPGLTMESMLLKIESQ